jgi:nucleotide-binding universal stress UspA family protein
MYHILVPIDGSEDRVRAQAETIADLPTKTDQLTVTIQRVFQEEDRAETTSVNQLPAGKLAMQLLSDADIDVETRTDEGKPASVIIHTAEEIEADHIVLGGRKRSPVGSLLFGSVSQAVVLDTSLPVTITGEANRE